MSENINATGYTDPAIAAIRNQVSTKSDGIPYLLLPVKIETRFMKVDKSIQEGDVFTDVLEGLFEIEDNLRFIPNTLPPQEVLGKIRKLIKKLQNITINLKDIKRLSGDDKENLQSKLLQIQINQKNLAQNLNRIRWDDLKKLKELRILKNELTKRLQLIKTRINKLRPDSDIAIRETVDFLNTLEEMNNALQNIGRKKLSSANRKEKKSLFAFVESQFSKFQETIKEAGQFMSINMDASNLQLKKMSEIRDELNELFPQVRKNISTVKSNYKKTEYKEVLNRLEDRAKLMHQEIDRRVKPKIKMKQELKSIDAREVIWQINIIRFTLKHQNRTSFSNFNNLNKVSNNLINKLKFLRRDVLKIIKSSESEQAAISKAWDDTDIELRKYTQKLKSFKAIRKQKLVVTRTINQINKAYRSYLAGLKSTSKSYNTTLTNSALEKSAINFSTSIKRLTELNREIENSIDKPATRRFTNAMKELVDFKETFSVLSRDIHVLPQKNFNVLKRLSAKIESNVNGLVSSKIKMAKLGKNAIIISKKAREAAGFIKSTAEKQVTDVLQPKNRVFEENRSPFVFARTTKTRDELWVRFYPDDIAIHTHEEALTEKELEAGKAYWHEIWIADDYEAKLSAWRAITTAYGPQRAAWIVKSLKPRRSRSKVIRKIIRLKSNEIVNVNDNLEKINRLLVSVGDVREQILAMGKSYPLLLKVEEDISNIVVGHDRLLLKTQKQLFKIQSQINRIVKNIRGLSDSERAVIQRQLEVVNQFVLTFNRIAKSFQGIKKLNSKEILKGEELTSVFPKVTIKSGSWTAAPYSSIMPEQFVVVTMTHDGNYKHLVAGKPLPSEKLIVGLDPDTFETESFQYDEDGNLIVDENIKWLTDFTEAEKKGMAVSITLDEDDIKNGFKKIFVVGVKNTSALEGKVLLEKLIDNHHYLPEGASFLPVSTPTNNTEAGESGYRTFEEDAALSFAVERNNEQSNTIISDSEFPTDAERLSEGLGIAHDVLNNLDYHHRTEVSESLIVNKALFNGTLGNYMEEGMDTLFTLDNIDHTKEFFGNYVTARGFLPSIRIGTQPYGILATTAFSQFNATADDSFIPELDKEDFDNIISIKDELQVRYDIRLKQLLNKIDSLWTTIRNKKVPHLGNTDTYDLPNPPDPQAHFMKMLGLQASSAEYFYRYGLNVAARQNAEEEGDFSINFDSNDPWSPSKAAETFRNIVLSGYYFKSDKFNDEHLEYSSILEWYGSKINRISDQFNKARIFATRQIKDQSQILGDIIDSRELAKEIVAITSPVGGTAEDQSKAQAELQNYVDWLVDNNPWNIHAENKYSEVIDETLSSGMPSTSLLFLIIRHSLLSAYADTILKILEHEGLTDQVTRKRMGQPGYFYSRFADGYNYVTKWSFLFSKIDRLDRVLGFEMDIKNGFFIYMNGQSGNNGYLNRYVSPEHTFVFNNYSTPNPHQVYMDELNTTRDAIRKLKDIPTLRLEQLLAEHIDLCTYRLDAWKLGMVNKRLKKQRDTTKSGIFLGAFGWVEDLKKGGKRTQTENIPSGLWKKGDDPVYTDEDNLGFIHTPSLNHAITAAILRAGFDANSDTAEINNQMAVNLSSGRVRMGLNLLNGIRNGQEAGAILGYQFERGLHERYLHIPLELDEYIYDFRDEFPLAVPVDDSLSLGEASLNNVVNGIELLETAQDFIDARGGPPNAGDSLYQSLKARENAWWNHIGNSNIKNANAAKRDAMLKEIDRMADAFDALGDLCISDSIYQVARGNHVRASAIMDKLAKGDVPNDIEIIDTPRTGTVVTHKVGIFFEAITGIDHELTETGANSVPKEGSNLETAVTSSGARPTGWNSLFTPRAIAEPTLNKWAGQMIGDPSKIKCQIDYTIGEIVSSMSITLADLEIQPLDALHLFGTGPLDGGAELNTRIAMKVKSILLLPAGFDGTVDDAKISIKYTKRNASWSTDDYSFYEKVGYIQSIRRMITDSAMLAADGLLIPGEEEVEDDKVRNWELGEYLIRIINLQARLKSLSADWNTFFTDEISIKDTEGHTFTNQQIDGMRSLLIRSSSFGIPGAVPDNLMGYGNKVGLALISASSGVHKAIINRLAEAENDIQLAKDDTKSNNVRVNAIQDAGKKLLGKVFVMLPHFNLRNGADIKSQLILDQGKGLLREALPTAMERWTNGLARVRERMAGLDTLHMWAENFNLTFPKMQPVQFPFELNEDGDSVDHWLGIEFPEGYQPTSDKLSLILMNAEEISIAPDTPKAAMLIDEWVEIIPNINETTGIAFNYDQPDAKPPNNLLLAVTPKETGQWHWDNLVYTLNDTLEMSKNRAVEPEHLEDTVFGQILPAIMTEIVPPALLPGDAGDNGDAQDNPLGLQVVTDFGVVNKTYDPESED